MAQRITQQCDVCQACEPAHYLVKEKIDMTNLIPRPIVSISIDVFLPPPKRWGGQNFDAMILWVDRFSGWIQAVPTQKEGLTAEKTAHIMMEHGWQIFGIPQIITSVCTLGQPVKAVRELRRIVGCTLRRQN